MRLAAVLGAPPRGPSPAQSCTPAQEKVIVFSQWTSMLDLVEMALKKEKYAPSFVSNLLVAQISPSNKGGDTPQA